MAALASMPELEPYLEHVRHPAGATVVREGELAEDMFFVLAGELRILRGALEVGRIGAGGHFGELGLFARRPRAATLVASSDVELGRLGHSEFEQLAADHPAVALELVRLAFATVGGWLEDMTHSVDVLLGERSLPRRAEVTVRIGGAARTVRTGTPLFELVPDHDEGGVVVAALVDRRPRSLASRISSDAVIDPLHADHWEGERIYRESVGLVLLEAASIVAPELVVELGHSIGFAQRVVVDGGGRDLDELAQLLEAKMRELVGQDLPLREEWWTSEEARTHFVEAGWSTTAQLLHTWRDASAPMVSYGRVYALGFGPLVHRTGLLDAFRLVAEGTDLLLVWTAPTTNVPTTTPVTPTRPVADEAAAVSRSTLAMMQAHGRWLDVLGTTSVGRFNRACIDGDVAQLVRVAEGFQEKQIGVIADAIAHREQAVKIVCVAGPSSSGKTTFIKRLRVQLQVDGIHPVGLSLDDYYCDRELTPRDDSGELDYEAFAAIQRDLLQAHVLRMLAGERVQTARYDFGTGKADADGGPTVQLGPDDVLLVEGIHGLNPTLLRDVPQERIFRVFLCPLAQLPFDRLTRVHASDLRLLRRIVRDRHGRGADAADSIIRWPSVRRGERLNIFVHARHADAVFDSSLIYELSVLKVFGERYLLEVPTDHAAYPTAFRLLRLLDRFVAIYPDHVPPTSILREFIGGSGFEY